MTQTERINKAAQVIREACGGAEVGLILGSGLADSIQLENAKTIEYRDIPNFPISTAIGHKSEWVSGTLHGKKVCMMRGRFHFYEGYELDDIALPVRVMKQLGVKTLIVTNAAGGVDLSFKPGDLMLINDHINFTGRNPLCGPNLDEFGVRFPDMSTAYDRELGKLAHRCADELNVPPRDGVYIWFTGPSYETPAEIRAARVLGASAVGMSTVPEVIVARHCGIRVLGITCISNMAAGILDQPLTHKEVMETGEMVRERFSALIEDIVGKMD